MDKIKVGMDRISKVEFDGVKCCFDHSMSQFYFSDKTMNSIGVLVNSDLLTLLIKEAIKNDDEANLVDLQHILNEEKN